MSKRKVFDLRNLMFNIMSTLPKSDRSQIAEWERDLACNVNCAIWECQVYKIWGGLRRLVTIPERGERYKEVMELMTIL